MEHAMNDAIIVLNAGSSSLKFSLYAVIDQELSLESRGQIDGLGVLPRFRAKDRLGELLADAPLGGRSGGGGHSEAFEHLVRWTREEYGSRLSLLAVGHRVTHGGGDYVRPTLINDEILEGLEQLAPLAPLHQPHNLAAVRCVMRLRPDLPQVACFDTAFHCGRPHVAQRFGLPNELQQRGVRRWGFYGLSYESIAGQFGRIAPETAAGRVIVAHLGNGASLCAMSRGESVDTTMSFSTLDGLPMGTRCGSLDPGVILFLLQQSTREEIERLLYEESGLRGISGISSDMRELLASNSPQAAEAVEFFVYRTIREVGSLTAALGGLDALIFTAGIGENSPTIRQRICQGLAWLGIKVAPEANERGGGRISPLGKCPSVWVIPTDEEGVIAAGTLAVVRSMVASGRNVQ
jgi:acetate kinase